MQGSSANGAPAARLPLRIAERYGRLYLWAQQLDLSPRDHAVLCHLIAAGDKNLSSWWSQDGIGRAIGISTSSVGRALAELDEGRQLIRRRNRTTDRGRTSDHVTVLAPADLVAIRLNESDRRAGPHEPDLGAYRLRERPVNSTGRMESEGVRSTEEPSDLEDFSRELPEGSSVRSTVPVAGTRPRLRDTPPDIADRIAAAVAPRRLRGRS